MFNDVHNVQYVTQKLCYFRRYWIVNIYIVKCDMTEVILNHQERTKHYMRQSSAFQIVYVLAKSSFVFRVFDALHKLWVNTCTVRSSKHI